uniref:Uncharacterized protein n=1 Tax=Pseudomonas fluorescens (strain SBW25) TaxID=216595 RepID=A4V6V0_PSEFS|nr:hypothetical protein pQBR0230 [Pseudomonas fluorescens SBW25]
MSGSCPSNNPHTGGHHDEWSSHSSRGLDRSWPTICKNAGSGCMSAVDSLPYKSTSTATTPTNNTVPFGTWKASAGAKRRAKALKRR